ncbi:MAG: aromatic ring-hydroxylating oxygenase subunit alpha [Gammaproteobacteria bacterium]
MSTAAGTAPPDPARLVHGDAVDPRVYTEPSIFALEMQRLWARSWLYVGHESKVPTAGDFLTTTLATRPVILCRGEDGALQVFHNRCAHKGTQLLCEASGQRRNLQCPYHGWTYALDGRLIARQRGEDYAGTAFASGSSETALQRLPGIASYRGFVFARITPAGPSLEDWLGPACSSFDNLVERSPAQALRVEGGALRYLHQCNWKMLLENVSDNLHAPVTHRSAIQPAREIAAALGAGEPRPPELDMILPFGSSYDFFADSGMTLLPNGHSWTGGTQSIHSAYPEDADYLAAMHAAVGEARTREILAVNRHNTVIYPGLSIKCALQTVRVYRPIAVDRTLQETWTLRLLGAPNTLFRRSLRYNQLVFSPASIAGQDDHECYRRMMAAASAAGPGVPVSLHRLAAGADAPTDAREWQTSGANEAVFRHEFRAWLAGMRDTDSNAEAAA